MFVVSQFVALVASLSLYLMPHPRRLVLPVAALAGTLLLHACPQAPPDAAALEHYHVHRLFDDTKERQIGCVDGQVTLLFNPGLCNYLLNVAQLDEMLPTSRPLS
jgi:hypothetical protein